MSHDIQSNIIMQGARIVSCPFHIRSSKEQTRQNISSADWKLDMAELESKITPRTKMLVLNTPHNPLGKVFSHEELLEIAELAKKHDILVMSDEVVSTPSLLAMAVRSNGMIGSMTTWC